MFIITGSIRSKRTTRSSSQSSRILLKHLQQTAEKLRRQQRCHPSKRTYYQAWHNFNNFIIYLDGWPETWEERLVMFTTNLIEVGHPEPTIRSYVSAVKEILKEDGVEIDNNSVELTAIFKIVQICQATKWILQIANTAGTHRFNCQTNQQVFY